MNHIQSDVTAYAGGVLAMSGCPFDGPLGDHLKREIRVRHEQIIYMQIRFSKGRYVHT